MTKIEEIFRSDELLVKKVGNFSKDHIVVTFDSYNDIYTLERQGFGESFFLQHKIDAIHFITKNNNWYQDNDIPDVLRKILDITKTYDCVFTYGSSMGGYAAIRHAAFLNARVIAFSPQYSVDSRVLPEERRWTANTAGIKFVVEKRERIPHGREEAIIFYDPLEKEDIMHVEKIAQDIPVLKVPLPYAGHVSIAFLMELGLLEGTILDIVNNNQLDLDKLLSETRARRKGTTRYYESLAQHLSRKHPALALAIIRKAVSLPIIGYGTISFLVSHLRANGLYDEAETEARKLIEQDPANTSFRKTFCLTLLDNNKFFEARKELWALMHLSPNKADICHLIASSYKKEASIRKINQLKFKARLFRYPVLVLVTLKLEALLSRMGQYMTRCVNPERLRLFHKK
ncbi:hypothetical protein PT277_07625 [Acetobacteraceae bacterium ESL0709]|nr:hypothetical protein [Acetobacteraceae bacterium ESL0697]MDF7678547.1 hypothetical protein [Acetobacteraceae bacterium ESL0709]